MVNFKRITLALAGLVPFIAAAPVANEQSDNSVNVDNKYIVTLKSGVSARDIESHLSWVTDVHKRSLTRRDLAGIEKTYDIGDFHGYAGSFDEETIEQIKNNPDASINLQKLLLEPESNAHLLGCGHRARSDFHP